MPCTKTRRLRPRKKAPASGQFPTPWITSAGKGAPPNWRRCHRPMVDPLTCRSLTVSTALQPTSPEEHGAREGRLHDDLSADNAPRPKPLGSPHEGFHSRDHQS